MRIDEWMTHDPLTVGADVKLQEALAQMVRHRVRHMPVLEAGEFLGLLSGPHLLKRLLVDKQMPLAQAAEQPVRAFVEQVDFLSRRDTLEEVLLKLNNQVCLPVLDDGRLEGLFSHHSLLGYLHRQLHPGRVRRGGATPTTHRLDSLLSLVRAVSTANNLQEMMEMTSHFLRNLMPLSEAFILLRQEAGAELKVAASFYNTPNPNKLSVSSMPIQDTLSGFVYTHRRSLRVDDLRDEKRFPRSAQLWKSPWDDSGENGLTDLHHAEPGESGEFVATPQAWRDLRSVIATPLLDQQKSFGVVHLWSDRPYAYVDSDLELLELVSGYLSFLILRSWQLQKEKELVQELQQANRIKDEFLAVVTHDLRNSIQGILALTQLLERRIAEPAQRELTRAIQDSVSHMSSLTRDLHDLAKLGMHGIRLNLSRCRLASTVKLVMQELGQFALQEKVTLEEADVDEGLEVVADPLRLRQIVANLVTNAIKYNKEGGWVRVRGHARSESEHPWVVLEVEDSGIGIAAEEQESVFQLFQRATNNRRLDGSGLGLSISQQLAELHGGRVELSSELGKGSIFRLFLPATKQTPRPLQQEATGVGGNTAA